ncbi:hypothetical protein GCM10010530_19920 [Kribbella aluminosa]
MCGLRSRTDEFPAPRLTPETDSRLRGGLPAGRVRVRAKAGIVRKLIYGMNVTLTATSRAW